MKIEVNREILAKGLNWVQNVVEKRSTMPVLSHALFRASKDDLEIVATNLQLVVEGHVEASVEKEGGVSLNAKRMHDIVRALPPGRITISVDEKNRAEIKGERGTFHLMGLAESEFPPLPEYKKTSFVEVKANILKDMVEKTIFAASMEETRYNLEGILLQVIDGKLRMVATDGHRLCLVDREVENAGKLDLANGLILPRKGLNELRKILAEGDGVEGVEFGVIDNDVVFKMGDVVIIMRTLEGDYPDYERVIPRENASLMVAGIKDMLDALGRVSIISDERTKGVKLYIDGSAMKIESQNPEVGDAYEELSVESKIKDLQIGYNARYLIDALAAMDGESVEVYLRDGLSSGLLKPKDDPDYLCVVMPMRL